MYSLIAGVLIGLSLAVPPGPINALIATAAVQKSHVDGIKIGMGAMTSDASYLVITLIGVSVLFTGDNVKMIVSFAGAFILAYFAFMTLKVHKTPLGTDGSDNGHPYLTGLAVGFANPYSILWWLTAGAAMITNFNGPGIVGFFIGILTWVSSFSLALHFARKKAEWLYPTVTLASGIVLVFFAGVLLYNAAQLASRILNF